MTVHAADIDATYENVHANCPHCKARNVYNRRDDLPHPGPIDNASVTCASCGESFDIVGDLINPSHELLLFDCQRLFEEKRYADVVFTAAKAHEVFFLHFMHVQFLWKPIGTNCGINLGRWSVPTRELDAKLSKFTFVPMRNLFLHHVLARTAPQDFDEAQACIAAIPKKPADVPRGDVDAVAEERLRRLLLGLHDTKINELRNRIAHKDAYRPTRDETWAAYEEASRILFGLTGELRLTGDAGYYINGAFRREPPAVTVPPSDQSSTSPGE